MAMIVSDLRLQLTSRADCDAVAAHLRLVHGDAITLRPPRHGRGGAWFVYGQLRYDPDTPEAPLIMVVLPETGQLLQIPQPANIDEPPADVVAAYRQARLRQAGAPQPRPDDGVDRHALHKRLREQQEPAAPTIPRHWDEEA